MKTYQHKKFRYYYDARVRSWVLYEIGSNDHSEYYANKASLLANYPNFKFIPEAK
jgi:hypothetical protein